MLLFACNQPKTTENKIVHLLVREPVEDTVPRTSITFIVGEDKSGYNQYYTLAGNYYRLNPDDKTELVIGTLTSILEVCNYLKNHPPQNHRPYGLINLVSHGNEFIDLSVLIHPKGVRASAASLIAAVRDSIFAPLDSSIIDSNTLIYLHGCAVGNNQQLLTALALAFGSNQNGVKVKASRLFEYYGYVSKNKNPQSIRHYFAKTWYAFQHPDSVFEQRNLVRQFANRYPNEQTHWAEGINRRFQANLSELYHFSFTVPVLWEEYYDDESTLPLLNSKTKKQEWLKQNKPLLTLLRKTHIPLDYFQFKYYTQKYIQNEEEVYVLRIKAKAEVICLIQPLLAENDSLQAMFVPFHPEKEDTLFFGFSTQM
jgi:hypothetical protein